MDIDKLLADVKARFSHNSAKEALKEKYSSKVFLADQGGYWRADPITIAILQSFETEKVILVDLYNNPVEVIRKDLLEKLKNIYETTMSDYYKEYKDIENKR